MLLQCKLNDSSFSKKAVPYKKIKVVYKDGIYDMIVQSIFISVLFDLIKTARAGVYNKKNHFIIV